VALFPIIHKRLNPKEKSMKQSILVCAFLFAAAAVAGANSIDYDTGNFMSGKLTGSFSESINVDITGSLHEIDIQTGKLIKNTSGCPTGSTCYDFSSGSVSVMENGGKIFSDSLTGGITIKGNGVASVVAVLLNQSGISNGGAVATFNFSGGKITAGSENVTFQAVTVPEPTSLMMLGSGLIGLAATRLRMFASK
jgi:PKD repeat protein